MIDYYKILGIHKLSSLKEIEEIYLSLKDKYSKVGIESQEYEKKLEVIEESYLILSNPSKREIYDLAYKLSKENEKLIIEGKNKESDTKLNEEEDWRKITKLSMPNEKKGSNLGWIYAILIILGLFFLFKNHIMPYIDKSATIIDTKVSTQSIIKTPTISIFEDKQNALETAEMFAKLLEEGSEGVRVLLDPNSQYFKNNVDSIDQIVHDTLKYGKYLKIYDLSISSYTNSQGKVSGYLENRSFYGWLKYYIEIYLSKVGNTWLVYGWNLKKT